MGNLPPEDTAEKTGKLWGHAGSPGVITSGQGPERVSQPAQASREIISKNFREGKSEPFSQPAPHRQRLAEVSRSPRLPGRRIRPLLAEEAACQLWQRVCQFWQKRLTLEENAASQVLKKQEVTLLACILLVVW